MQTGSWLPSHARLSYLNSSVHANSCNDAIARPKFVQDSDRAVQNSDNNVRITDEFVQDMDENVQILDSIPNSTINIKSHFVQSENGEKAGQTEKKNNWL